jgi:hypothetical protein
MRHESSRRTFLASGLALPALAAQSAKPVTMAHRTLGKTGLKVAPLGFGGRGTSEAGVVLRAVDLGVNYFDTGRSYANNERFLGTALKGRRKDVIFASKTHGATKKEALADLDTSLREFQTDYLDIWHLHGKVRPEEVTDELLETLQDAKKAGKARFVGISTHLNMPVMIADMLKRGRLDVMMVAHNYTLNPDVAEAIRTARQAGMGIIAMKVLAGGFARIEGSEPRFEGSVAAIVKTLKQQGAMTAAIRWALTNESVDTSAVCMADFDQVEQNVAGLSKAYSAEDESLLGKKLAYLAPRYCRMCGACGGVCENGVRVADTLRFLAYAEGYRDFPLARQSYLDLPEDSRRIQCADCRLCTVHCPNGVQVQARLIRAQQLLA